MTWLAPKLNKRVDIGKPLQVANSSGGFDFSFSTLLTVWMGLRPITPGEFMRAQYIRGVQTEAAVTHKFIARRAALTSLARHFSSSFSSAFDSVSDLTMIKSDMFLFVRGGSASKGRLFRIRNIVDNAEQREFFNISAEEIEEQGTGYEA